MMNFSKKILAAAVGGMLALASGSALASGFALIEQGASGMGNAYAGRTVIANDASTIFDNPAGMSYLSGTQLAVTVNAIDFSSKYSGTLNGAAPLQPAVGGTGGNAGSLAWVPNAHFVTEINQDMRFGLSVSAPFGLQTSYDPTWMGRFQAIKSQIKTINLNPSVSWRLNDQVSIGGGLNYQRINGELSSAVNYSAAAFSVGGLGAVAAIGGAGVEGVSTVTGSDSAWGYNLGAMFQLSPQTRIGLAYRSAIKYTLNGTVSFTNVPALLAAGFANGPVTLAIKMPESWSAGVFHKLDDKWDIMFGASRTGWSALQQLRIDRTSGANLTTVPENWHDTWNVAVGSSYHYNERWTARIGVAYDQSPVPDLYRTARIPGSDRTWLALGGQYKFSGDDALDFAYNHLFMKNAPVNQSAAVNTNLAASGAGYLLGSYSNSVNILSVQYTHNF